LPSRNPSVGVDIVEIKKAAAFYRRHKKRLKQLFTETEMIFILKNPAPNLAIVLAAKEAVYKALPAEAGTMGPSGFKNIRISPERGKKLSFRLAGAYASVRPRPSALSAERYRHFVVARCAGTS
jgi:phosphopantetheine--protein transferase-like protein